jgi:Holliday junction resolvasome RuvABC endonuclease subunit
VIILAADPGPTHSGVVYFDTHDMRVSEAFARMPNDQLLAIFRSPMSADAWAVESIEALYAHVGKETVNTIRFCGALQEAVLCRNGLLLMISPQEVKKSVCGTSSAKDPAVRQALLDQLGPVGTKRDKGPCYGVSSHAWRALAVALAFTKGSPP